MSQTKKCICGDLMTAAEWKYQWVCHRCGRTKPFREIEIDIGRRIKYAEDVYNALLELGWDADTAASFLNNIPDAE